MFLTCFLAAILSYRSAVSVRFSSLFTTLFLNKQLNVSLKPLRLMVFAFTVSQTLQRPVASVVVSIEVVALSRKGAFSFHPSL